MTGRGRSRLEMEEATIDRERCGRHAQAAQQKHKQAAVSASRVGSSLVPERMEGSAGGSER